MVARCLTWLKRPEMKLNLAFARPYFYYMSAGARGIGLQVHRDMYLRLVECIPIDFLFEGLGDCGALKNAILAEE